MLLNNNTILSLNDMGGWGGGGGVGGGGGGGVVVFFGDLFHTYMLNTFEAVIDKMEKCDLGGYFELIFISYIVLEIQ